jgi:hypothetical protein
MKKYLKSLLVLSILSLLVFPVLTFAQTTVPQPGGGFDMGKLMSGIAKLAWEFFAGLAVVMFVFAGVMFLTSTGDPGKIKTARDAFLWGVVGIIVAILAFSITTIIKTSVGG